MVRGPEELQIETPGRLAFFAVVAQALFTTYMRPDSMLDARGRALVTAMCVVYLGLAYSNRVVVRLGVVPYLVLQNLAALAIVAFAHGLASLASLAIISQAVLVLPRSAVIGIAAMHAANATFFFSRWHGWARASTNIPAFLAAEVFVIAFTEIAGKERRGRAELAEANRKMSEYATQAEELATTRERNRLARELHDSLGHYLTVIHVHLEAAASHVEKDPATAKVALERSARLVHEGLDDVRMSVAALRAPESARAPLPDALKRLLDELTASGTTGTFTVTGSPRPVSPAVELTLFRAAQEGLTNVQKHARASRAEVTLTFTPTAVRLSVVDDGQGGDQTGSGFGLLGVRERARIVGGTLEVKSGPGFSLSLSIPA